MNLGRIFATALARRVAFVVVAAVLGYLGMGVAEAQSYPDCADTTVGSALCPDQPSAYSNAVAAGAALSAKGCAGIAGHRTYTDPPVVDYSVRRVRVYVRWVENDARLCNADRYWPESGSCSAQPPLNNVRYHGEGGVCSGGCAYAADLNGGAIERTQMAGQTISKVARMLPTGESCTVGDGTATPNTGDQDECVQQGTLTQCVKANGDLCSQASNGKRFCWSPTEHGIKTSTNEAASKVPAGEVANLPPVAPANGGDWKHKASTPVTQTTTVNNTTTTQNSVINHYESSYGKEGGGAKGGGADGEKGGEGAGGGEGDGDGHGTVTGGGTCDEPLACSGGDPVLCAIARQQYLARCEAEARGKADFGALPTQEAGNDPDPSDGHRTVGLGFDRIDQSGWLGGGQCPQFAPVETMFGTFQIDADQWCQWIGVVRACLLLLGAFIAIGILVGRGD